MKDLLKIFKKKSNSADDIVSKHQSITLQKAELILQCDALKKQLLHGGDAAEITKKLKAHELEIELSDLACTEIQQELTDLLTRQVADDFAKLPAEKEAYEKELRDNIVAAGQAIGRGMLILRQIHAPGVAAVVTGIDGVLKSVREKHGEKLESFEEGLTSGGSGAVEIRDLESWKRKLDKISTKAPGSEPAVNHVRNRVKRLLNIKPPVEYKIQTQPLPGIFGRSV